MKKILFAVIYACLLLLPASADVLYLNEGEEIIGRLISFTKQKIEFQNLNGANKTLQPEEVAHILISKIRQGDAIKKVGQITDPIVKQILKKLPASDEFPDADYVTLYRRGEFSFTSAGEIIYTSRNIVQILKEAGLDEANNSIYYYTEREEAELLYAHTYSSEGNVYHITDDAISEEALWSGTPEFARLTKIKMALKKVELGSIIDYAYTRKITDVNNLQPYTLSYVFGEREPVLREEFAVDFPQDVKLEKHFFQWNDEIVAYKESQKDNRTYWQWSFSDPNGFIPEQNMLSGGRIFPRVIVYQQYSWEETAKALSKAYNDARPKPEALKKLIEQAKIDDFMTDYEKAAALYEFLNRDIRDLGLSITQMGSFIPVSTQIAINKKYGNPQNILALLHFALESLNIESYVGFCSSKRENATVKDFASLGFADYAVLKVVIDGHDFYTDGGSIYRPFATLSTGIQGAQACFIDLKKPEFFFARLPRTTFDWNKYDRNVFVKILQNGNMDVQETIHFRGPFESSIRELKSVKDQDKRNYAEKRVKRVHPNAILKGFGFSDMEKLNSPAVLTLRYEIPQAAQKASENIMTFTNYWVNYRSSSASLQKRKYPMQYWSTEENSNTVVFELPQQFKWVAWDKQYSYASGNISFNSNMFQHSEQLVYTDRFIARDDEFLDDKSYQNYRKCILTMSELANQWIIIEKEDEELPPSGTDSSESPAQPKIKKEPQGQE
jgi:hypothetical protein